MDVHQQKAGVNEESYNRMVEWI